MAAVPFCDYSTTAERGKHSDVTTSDGSSSGGGAAGAVHTRSTSTVDGDGAFLSDGGAGGVCAGGTLVYRDDAVGGDAPSYRLDHTNVFVSRPDEASPALPWVVSLYGPAGEATVVQVPDARLRRRRGSLLEFRVWQVNQSIDQADRERIAAQIADQVAVGEQRSRRNAASRARSMVRRLVKEHGLFRMWTLTCATAVRSYDQLEAIMREFQLRWYDHAETRGRAYVAVPEWHPGGHGLHVHLAVRAWIPYQVINACWTWGLTETPRTNKQKRGVETLEQCARYLAKYASKEIAVDEGSGTEEGGEVKKRRKGQHRYFRSGDELGVTVERERYGSRIEAEGRAIAWFGGMPDYEFRSEDAEPWDGPPLTFMGWNKRDRRAM